LSPKKAPLLRTFTLKLPHNYPDAAPGKPGTIGVLLLGSGMFRVPVWHMFLVIFMNPFLFHFKNLKLGTVSVI
jgi:hypothetical protein